MANYKITNVRSMEDHWGGRYLIKGIDLLGGTSDYNEQSPTGLGYPIYPAVIGMKVIHGAVCVGISGGTLANGAGLITQIDKVTLAPLSGVCVRFYYPTGGGTVPASIGTPSGSIPAGATPVTSSSNDPSITLTAGLGVQVAAGTNLTTVQVRILIFGME